MKRVVLLLASCLLIISQSIGQFVLKAEFRPRFEYRNGYGEMLSKDEKPVLTVSQRSRLYGGYTNGIFSCALSVQDVRVWGDDDIYGSTGVAGSKASIDLNEAWIGINPYKKGLIKIGRQYWNYEDERLLSPRAWNQSEIKYDGILFRHQADKIQADIGLSWNNNQENLYGNEYPSGKFKTLNFIYLKAPITDWLYLSAMGIVSGFTASDTTPDINIQGTYGGYAGVSKNKLTMLFSGFYQSGKNRGGKQTSAFMFSITGNYTLSKKFSAGAGIDYLSGNDQDNQDPDYKAKNHSFDIFYGARHRYYGHLDYFTNLPKGTSNGGLADIFLKFKWNLTEKASAGIDLHYFSLQNNVLDKEGAVMKKGLGEEIDLYLNWDILKFLNVKGGYSTFFATETMETIQGVYGNARFPGWVWLMVTAKPTFLDTAAK